jgi:hypothetical protein
VLIGARPSPRAVRRRRTEREDNSGRETVHGATDTIIELVSRIKRVEPASPSGKERVGTSAEPAATQVSRESDVLPQS